MPWPWSKPAPLRRVGIPAAARLPRDNTELRIGPVALGNDWGQEYSLRDATKIAVNVTGGPIEVQLARAHPPAPPSWGAPIPVPVGFWSHVGPFGYIRMRNHGGGSGLLSGGAATVEGVMYAE